MSYIVKNCPCRMELPEDDCFGHTGYHNCCACTDCVIKQAIERCINEINGSARWSESRAFAEELLELFNIEEINK